MCDVFLYCMRKCSKVWCCARVCKEMRVCGAVRGCEKECVSVLCEDVQSPRSQALPVVVVVGEGVAVWGVSGGGFTGTTAEVGDGWMVPKVLNIPDCP